MKSLQTIGFWFPQIRSKHLGQALRCFFNVATINFLLHQGYEGAFQLQDACLGGSVTLDEKATLLHISLNEQKNTLEHPGVNGLTLNKKHIIS